MAWCLWHCISTKVTGSRTSSLSSLPFSHTLSINIHLSEKVRYRFYSWHQSIFISRSNEFQHMWTWKSECACMCVCFGGGRNKRDISFKSVLSKKTIIPFRQQSPKSGNYATRLPFPKKMNTPTSLPFNKCLLLNPSFYRRLCLNFFSFRMKHSSQLAFF